MNTLINNPAVAKHLISTPPHNGEVYQDLPFDMELILDSQTGKVRYLLINLTIPDGFVWTTQGIFSATFGAPVEFDPNDMSLGFNDPNGVGQPGGFDGYYILNQWVNCNRKGGNDITNTDIQLLYNTVTAPLDPKKVQNGNIFLYGTQDISQGPCVFYMLNNVTIN